MILYSQTKKERKEKMTTIYDEILKNIGFPSNSVQIFLFCIFLIIVGLILLSFEALNFNGTYGILAFGIFYFSTTPLIESFRGIRNKFINKKEAILLYKELKGTENWKETENIKEIVKFVEEKAKKFKGKETKYSLEIMKNVPTGVNIKYNEFRNFAKIYIADKEQVKIFGKAETNLPYEQVEKICNNVLQLDKNCIEHFNIKKDYTPIKKQG